MTEFKVKGTRYAITAEGPAIGWPCEETLVLWQIGTAQRSKHGKAEFYDERRRMMRACTVDELLRYVARISRAEVDEVRRVYEEGMQNKDIVRH